MPRLKRFFGGSTAFVGAWLAAWQGVTVYFLLTGRIEEGWDQPPLDFSVTLLILGLIMLIGGWWAGRET